MKRSSTLDEKNDFETDIEYLKELIASKE